MPRFLPAALSALSLLSLAATSASASQDLPATSASTGAPATYSPDDVIVQWAAAAGRRDRAEARAEAEVAFASDLGARRFQLLETKPGQVPGEAVAELEANPAVVAAERDSYSIPTSTPDDPLFAQEWGLENLGAGIGGFAGAIAGADIDAAAAWSRTVGEPSTVVADIDSGYRFDSPDLGPVAWTNPGETAGDGSDNDGNGYVDDVHGYDFVGASSESPAEDDDPTDDDLISGGHGVHTAGTIGAAGDNAVGITGVAQDIRMMPLRVCANAPGLDESRCPTSSIIAAINYAGANGARVANISLSGTTESTLTLTALAENPETLFVVAAGNDSEDNDSAAHYPCNYEPGSTFIAGAVENVVCVAATDQADQLASFSDWGAESVDLGAPGTEILSTYPATEAFVSDDFEQDDFATKWKPTGIDGGFARTSEAPLTSFGISDSPEAAAVADSSRSSTLSSPVAVPAGYGACRFSGRDFASLGGGSATLIVFKNGVSAFSFQIPDSGGSEMTSFTTAPMPGLAGTMVGVRVRYAAGSSPTAASGVWLDDLGIRCNAPLDTPPSYAYLQGTSMAAPHVTGVAALLVSEKPVASVEELRDALLSSVDANPSLADKTATGGRLDAAKALSFLQPPAPLLSATDPLSPASEDSPRIVGSAELGSIVVIHRGGACEGPVVAAGPAAELESPGILVSVPNGTSAEFSAVAVNAADNESSCSDPSISYTAVPLAVIGPGEVITDPLTQPLPSATMPGAAIEPLPPVPSCTVPKLAGKTLGQARAALAGAGCRVGRVSKPKVRKGRKQAALVVKSSSPAAGSTAGGAVVALALGPKPKNQHH